MKTKKIFALFIFGMMQITAYAQFTGPRTGFFHTLTDVGSPLIPGSATYSKPDQQYLLEGSGSNIWFGEDHFTFLWKEMEGDFMIQARVRFPVKGVDPHRKTGLMIRSGLENNAPHVSCVIHGDGLTSLQYRHMKGADMEEKRFDLAGPDMIQLEKKGSRFTMSAAHFGETFSRQSIEIELSGQLQAGLFICAHNDTVNERALFSNVRVFGTAPDDLVQYETYLGSLLEVLDVETGERRILDGADGSWQAPNWTPDGKYLIYNADGLLYRYDLNLGESHVLPTGFAVSNNNDHVLSFDGKRIGISHHAEEDGGQSVIYTLPAGGGTPRRVTPESPSYLHGWSPDGRYLVYTGGRDGNYDIYKIPAGGGGEIRLTNAPELDDGPEYSPDGKYIYFNSARTGTMQIWRMDPDGGNQTQLTFDAYNDWFPHVSPDNRWIIFLSFPEEVPADAHPFYERVYLRIMAVDDLEQAVAGAKQVVNTYPEPRVVGYVYGGQGTINVPGWSPGSKKVAFISNGIFNP
ncbi:MAG TPA: biopolymer transporter TolR [Bacteroides sp.]|nr:biopolymer transporter TolR [Bacteroides sp.]